MKHPLLLVFPLLFIAAISGWLVGIELWAVWVRGRHRRELRKISRRLKEY